MNIYRHEDDYAVKLGSAEGIRCEFCEQDELEYDFRVLEVLKMLDDERVIRKIRHIMERKS